MLFNGISNSFLALSPVQNVVRKVKFKMEDVYVYHAVTEKAMELGQIITFDRHHFNGVYHRVMTCKKILDGNKPSDDFSKDINANLDYWKVRTFRELALERVRREKYPNYPSRLACLYTTKTLSNAEMWADSFLHSGREVLQIVKLRTNGRIFNGDAFNVFDGTSYEAENEKNAEHYWNNQPNKYGKQPLIETLIDGNIEVVEIVKRFK